MLGYDIECPLCESTDVVRDHGDWLTCVVCNTSFGVGPSAEPRQPDRYSTVSDASTRTKPAAGDLSGWLPGQRMQ